MDDRVQRAANSLARCELPLKDINQASTTNYIVGACSQRRSAKAGTGLWKLANVVSSQRVASFRKIVIAMAGQLSMVLRPTDKMLADGTGIT